MITGSLTERRQSSSRETAIPAPVFIVAVPRSGSTMLRLMLNAHPLILSGRESPWLGGNYWVDGFDPDVSVRALYRRLLSSADADDMPVEELRQICREFVMRIARTKLERSGKLLWIEKTPDNIVQVGFLRELFPQARFIRLIRDGRDVALSTIRAAWPTLNYFVEGIQENHRFIHARIALNRRVLFRLPRTVQEVVTRARSEPARNEQPLPIMYPIANTYYNALYRWHKWNEVYEGWRGDVRAPELTLKYEDLLLDPRGTFVRLFQFLNVPMHERVFDYSVHRSEDHRGDIGLRSALQFSSMDPRNVYKWRRDLTRRQRRTTARHFDKALALRGYDRTDSAMSCP